MRMYSILVEIGGYVPQDFTYVTLIINVSSKADPYRPVFFAKKKFLQVFFAKIG